MATITFTGNAKAVQQVQRFTPGGTIGTETFTMTCNGKTIYYVAQSGDTAALVVAGIVAAFATSTAPEFINETTFADGTSYVEVTTNTPGVPVTITSSATGAATFVQSTVTAASGPNYADVAANYSGNATPTTGDTLYIEGDVPILYGLDLNAVTLAARYIQNRSAPIGLPPVNANGYPEYRTQRFKISATIDVIDQTTTAGLIRLDVGSVSTTLTQNGSGPPTDALCPAVDWIGSNTSNILNIGAGDFGAGTRPGETAKIATLRIGDGLGSNPTVNLGVGVTIVTINQASGDCTAKCGITTATVEGGKLTRQGSATCTTVNSRFDGQFRDESSGTITTVNAGTGGAVDCNHLARTYTTVNAYAGCRITDAHKNVTFTNGIQLQHCRLKDCDIDVGPNAKITPS